VALLLEERDTCHGCGQPRSVSMLPESERRYTVKEGICHACEAREIAGKPQRGHDGKPLPAIPGVKSWVIRRT
jgi:hypothetical protein